MKAYFIFTKKRLITVFFALVCIAVIYSQVYSAGNFETVNTNAERLNFINGMGYYVLNTQPTVKEVIIPTSFGDVYNNYNAIQYAAGYDLSLYKGCEATIYTYSIQAPDGYTGDCVINIIIYNNRIIGGDVSSCALGGFMLPLKSIDRSE